METSNTNNILAVLESFMLTNADDISLEIAKDFRQRRIEKNMTRAQIAKDSGVAISNITRFEQTGLISLKHLINLAIALNYTSEIKNIFSQPKYSTMEELLTIRENSKRKKAYPSNTKREKLR